MLWPYDRPCRAGDSPSANAVLSTSTIFQTIAHQAMPSSPTHSASLQLLHRLSPDQAVTLGTVGALLIFFEFNRPGRVYAGSVGLLFALFAVAAILRMEFRVVPVACLCLIMAMYLLNLYRPVPVALLAACTGGGIVALRCLIRPGAGSSVHTVVAVLCGGVLGVAATMLTRIAYRARRAKALR